MPALFDLETTLDDAELIVIPVPWDVTVSEGTGAALAPQAIIDISHHIDLSHPVYKDPWNAGIFAIDTPDILVKSKAVRPQAQAIIDHYESKAEFNEEIDQKIQQVNADCEQLNQWLSETCATLIEEEKLIAVLGGDHSVSLGFINALSERVGSFGVLQIDAHMDLRPSYQFLEYSHASVMNHALKNPEVKRLVQVGVRDYSIEESYIVKDYKGRISTFSDYDIHYALFNGKTWHSICKKIVNQLPDMVYISCDIDGFSPSLCPNTGTPVVGGLTFEQVQYLLIQIVQSGRRIIGVDLVEVVPNPNTQYDQRIAAQVLFELCAAMLETVN